MDFETFLQVICAVIVANALCAAFAVGALAAVRFEKKGVHQNDLPLWVYACLIIPLLVAAAGAWVGYSLI